MAKRSRWVAQPFEPVKQALRAQLRRDERLLALGRTSVSEAPRARLAGSTSTIVAVTPERLIWSGRGSGPFHELRWEQIRGYAEGREHHRCAILLEHDEVERVGWVPAHRFLWWRWGNATGVRTHRRTIFEFSRSDTGAAEAMRAELSARPILRRAPLRLPVETARQPSRAMLVALRGRPRRPPPRE